jgi:hypothetical protein
MHPLAAPRRTPAGGRAQLLHQVHDQRERHPIPRGARQLLRRYPRPRVFRHGGLGRCRCWADHTVVISLRGVLMDCGGRRQGPVYRRRPHRHRAGHTVRHLRTLPRGEVSAHPAHTNLKPAARWARVGGAERPPPRGRARQVQHLRECPFSRLLHEQLSRSPAPPASTRAQPLRHTESVRLCPSPRADPARGQARCGRGWPTRRRCATRSRTTCPSRRPT